LKQEQTGALGLPFIGFRSNKILLKYIVPKKNIGIRIDNKIHIWKKVIRWLDDGYNYIII
jgi:hypothetical protein